MPHERGDCTNNRSVTRKHVEGRVLAALVNHLADPELLAEYVRTFQEKFARRQADSHKRRRPIEKRLAAIGRELKRIVDEVANGTASRALVGRMVPLEQEEDELRAALADMEQAAPDLTILPSAAERYRRNCEDLQAYVNGFATASRRPSCSSSPAP